MDKPVKEMAADGPEEDYDDQGHNTLMVHHA